MGSNPTKGDGLLCLVHVLDKGTISKAAIMTVIVKDVDTMLICYLFKGMICIHGFLCSKSLIEVHVCEVTCMIHKDSNTTVPFGCRLTFGDWDEPRNG